MSFMIKSLNISSQRRVLVVDSLSHDDKNVYSNVTSNLIYVSKKIADVTTKRNFNIIRKLVSFGEKLIS